MRKDGEFRPGIDYTAEEETWLRTHYPQQGLEWCAQHLGRPVTAIRGKVSVMGLKLNPSGSWWKKFQHRARISKIGVPQPSRAWVPRQGIAPGRRPDLNNQRFRSRWEANWARYLNFLQQQGQVTKWAYEIDEFWFHAVKRGQRQYLPDFKVWLPDGRVVYHEVKGYMDRISRVKLNRMRQYYPDVEIQIIDRERYRAVERQLASIIPHWERYDPKRPRIEVELV